MIQAPRNDRGIGAPLAIFLTVVVVCAVLLAFFAKDIRRAARESLMQSVTSSHYEILCPAGMLSQDVMTNFATQREKLYTSLDHKLDDAASNKELRVIFDPQFAAAPTDSGAPSYTVTGTTIRTKLVGAIPELPAAADAQALLQFVWGKPGNTKIAEWTTLWLAGDYHGAEIGMAAAELEQHIGHKPVATVLSGPPDPFASAEDQTLLGAAWISQIAEFGGSEAVHKLYSAKMAQPTVAEVTRILGTSPVELDRKWQMWMYAYLAGMPAMQENSRESMPMNMPMNGR